MKHLSMRRQTTVATLIAVTVTVVGYWLGLKYSSDPLPEPLVILSWFFVLPVCISIVGFGIGWLSKRRCIVYTPPDWDFRLQMLDIDEAAGLQRAHNREYWRMVADSTFWNYYIPVVLVVLSAMTPPLFTEYSSLIVLLPVVTAVNFVLLFLTSLVGGFRSTSNQASKDFTIRLLREAIYLAREQQKIEALSVVRVAVEMAQDGGLRVYRHPRVIAKISGIEEHATIESWSDEMGALCKIHCVLYPEDETQRVDWWWKAGEEAFFKHMTGRDGYYVKSPLPFKRDELSVKDIQYLTRNAILLIVMEMIHRGVTDKHLEDIKNQLLVSEN